MQMDCCVRGIVMLGGQEIIIVEEMEVCKWCYSGKDSTLREGMIK